MRYRNVNAGDDAGERRPIVCNLRFFGPREPDPAKDNKGEAVLRVPGILAAICGRPTLPNIFIIHVMKTGGTSVREALAGLYPTNRCLFDASLRVDLQPRSAIASPCFVAGHRFAWQAFEPRFDDFIKLVVLRDPLERFTSHYRHLRWLKAQGYSPSPDIEAAATCGVREFFDSPCGRLLRHLSLWQLGLDRGEYSVQVKSQLEDLRRGRHPPFDVLAARAKARLDRCFVALQEELPLSMRLFSSAMLGSRHLVAERLNETPPEFGDGSERLSPGDVARMREELEPDYEVYRHACRLFRKQLAAADLAARATVDRPVGSPVPQPAIALAGERFSL